MDPFKFRRQPPTERELSDLRPPFAVDVDRILHSRAYTRYIDKTQVFYLLKNDHITHRVLHVQIVSRIARTIGQKLGLNLDLIEAASLGHDLGHAPFGHDGEVYLSDLCLQAGLTRFVHPVMSLRFLEQLEKKGSGLNLTLGVLDAILCHDGESDFTRLEPDPTNPTFDELDRRKLLRTADPAALIRPMTAEGCLIRLCDTVSYVGRDLEDAIELGLVKRSAIPPEITQTLSNTNGTIVYRLVEDLIQNSCPDRLGFSERIAVALTALKDFNRDQIYFNPKIKTEAPKIKRLYRLLFEAFLQDFQNGPVMEACQKFASSLSETYLASASPAEMTRDLIAGMTDEYFLRQASILLLPKWNLDSFN
ncbi:MAG: HD domain-containing protein [Deltaproteobacteria bacterium]|jgi:dGTPase|nr:HD domain-containing protein [Deltaproteobacteria bacterium]